ncbi:polysaccharide deacetylase family protein [Sphingobacterium griseoflavum]|uniref:Polysaccharide deacetylase n=1 Tax=Sphingobacterium griseoflavum TaxID=1474952 RepID=A0ABQ3I050_9SPHI|nr:polysaccharide deacetylase family protein [Sphingobacterium griseoflavum]GHE40653.1 polysaccharide deacetylase [Sphingobacterium griseoflavum]
MLKHRWVKPLNLAFAGLSLVYALFGGSLLWFVSSGIIALALTAWGVFDIRLSYFMPVFYREKNCSTKRVALTFDDGPSDYTSEILDLLYEFDSKATFFCIGIHVERLPQVVQRMLLEGHTIANHTLSHERHFGFLPVTRLMKEIDSCTEVIAHAVGKRPVLFRPPFGVTNPSVAKAVKSLELQAIGWSNRSLDTVIDNEEKLFRRVVGRLRPGDIILLHDTKLRTARVLRRILLHLKAEGYSCVSVDDLLNLQAYEG